MFILPELPTATAISACWQASRCRAVQRLTTLAGTVNTAIAPTTSPAAMM